MLRNWTRRASGWTVISGTKKAPLWGRKKKIPPTTRILLRVLIPQNLKHINFRLENSEKAVNGSQISVDSIKKKGFNFQKKEVDVLVLQKDVI